VEAVPAALALVLRLRLPQAAISMSWSDWDGRRMLRQLGNGGRPWRRLVPPSPWRPASGRSSTH